jgi:hypothetical protein
VRTYETGNRVSEATPGRTSTADELRSPVDDRTYNLLQALTSTLEAIDAYELYASEDGQAALFEELLVNERRHAEILVDELRSSLVGLAGEGRSPGATDAMLDREASAAR